MFGLDWVIGLGKLLHLARERRFAPGLVRSGDLRFGLNEFLQLTADLGALR